MKQLALDTMDSYEFKDLIVNLFQHLGYSNIKVGPETAIKGMDITMEKATDIGTVKYLVQCEHQPMGVVKLPVVKILHSTVVSTPTLDKGLLITSGRFSSDAIEYAEQMGIELIDGLKLIELGKKAGLDIQKKPNKLIDNCLPISNKSQITLKLLKFLSANLNGFLEQTAKIEEINLRLKPSYMVNYSIDSDFTTSARQIHSIHENTTTFLMENGKLFDSIIVHAACSQQRAISTINQESLSDISLIEKGEFTKTFKEIKDTAKETLIDLYTTTVGYYGANNVHYTKTCVPKQKDIEISEVKQVYIPFWQIVFSIMDQKYAMLAIEDYNGLTVLPSRMLNLNESPRIKVYPDTCMICHNDLGSEKFVCSICGKITCQKDKFNCKICGKQLCQEHTVFKRRLLIFKDKYCQSCFAQVTST